MSLVLFDFDPRDVLRDAAEVLAGAPTLAATIALAKVCGFDFSTVMRAVEVRRDALEKPHAMVCALDDVDDKRDRTSAAGSRWAALGGTLYAIGEIPSMPDRIALFRREREYEIGARFDGGSWTALGGVRSRAFAASTAVSGNQLEAVLRGFFLPAPPAEESIGRLGAALAEFERVGLG